jgi:hypothetical protein
MFKWIYGSQETNLNDSLNESYLKDSVDYPEVNSMDSKVDPEVYDLENPYLINNLKELLQQFEIKLETINNSVWVFSRENEKFIVSASPKWGQKGNLEFNFHVLELHYPHRNNLYLFVKWLQNHGVNVIIERKNVEKTGEIAKDMKPILPSVVNCLTNVYNEIKLYLHFAEIKYNNQIFKDIYVYIDKDNSFSVSPSVEI